MVYYLHLLPHPILVMNGHDRPKMERTLYIPWADIDTDGSLAPVPDGFALGRGVFLCRGRSIRRTDCLSLSSVLNTMHQTL